MRKYELHIRAVSKTGEHQSFHKTVVTDDTSSSRVMRAFETEIKLKGYKVQGKSVTLISSR